MREKLDNLIFKRTTKPVKKNWGNTKNLSLKSLTELIKKAAIDPNPMSEFIFGDPLLKAFRPSKSKSAQDLSLKI